MYNINKTSKISTKHKKTSKKGPYIEQRNKKNECISLNYSLLPTGILAVLGFNQSKIPKPILLEVNMLKAPANHSAVQKIWTTLLDNCVLH